MHGVITAFFCRRGNRSRVAHFCCDDERARLRRSQHLTTTMAAILPAPFWTQKAVDVLRLIQPDLVAIHNYATAQNAAFPNTNYYDRVLTITNILMPAINAATVLPVPNFAGIVINPALNGHGSPVRHGTWMFTAIVATMAFVISNCLCRGDRVQHKHQGRVYYTCSGYYDHKKRNFEEALRLLANMVVMSRSDLGIYADTKAFM